MDYIKPSEVNKQRILDVRTHEEYDTEHIPGSQHIVLDHLAGREQEVPENPIIVCRTGPRAEEAVNILGRGRVLKGGITAWKKAGMNVE
jgi:rhodanese-related sulfurtransferase